MKRVKIIFILFILGHLSLFAQIELNDESSDIYSDDLIIEADSIQNNLLPEYASDFIIDSKEEASSLVEDLSDALYISRLAAIQTPIAMTFNSLVKEQIMLYTQRRRGQVERMLGLSEHYFPIFEEALDARNMPLELKYLPIIESALNPVALSRAGASGIWQFMLRTGKLYGLEVTSYVDERRDPEKSTYAAVKYLSDLYDMYGDWHLAIAAYNCGPGNINKAIKRSDGKRDFWEIYPNLPTETRGYVPAFIAATYAMHYASDYQLNPVVHSLPEDCDTIMVYQPLHFQQVSDILQIPVESIRSLNPQYRRDVIPADENRGYSLKLSADNTVLFASHEDSIYNYKREHFFPNNRLVVNPSDTKYPIVSTDGRAAIQYTIKSGDVVGRIAEWFNVKEADIRYWNNLSGNKIRAGQKLTIYVPKNKEDHYREVAKNRSGQTKATTKQVSTTTQTPTTTQVSQTPSKSHKIEHAQYEYYTVRQGDTLWSIAQKFPGVTNEDIKKWNNIEDAKKLKPGMTLKIKVANS
ncbi:MAG: transglycosylase SLT domain-containing protein [Marinilabiliaceae bacterium]|nr:transglycosylase SLT domain-containing protein [Marinilabiliaceae bacterium]